jgi:hypothetical protein
MQRALIAVNLVGLVGRGRPAGPLSSGVLASSSVARRVLFLAGCGPALRTASGVLADDEWLLSTSSVLGSSTAMGSSGWQTPRHRGLVLRASIALGLVGMVEHGRSAGHGLGGGSRFVGGGTALSLVLHGCAPALRSDSGVLAGDGTPLLNGQRARFLDGDRLTRGTKRRATAFSRVGQRSRTARTSA